MRLLADSRSMSARIKLCFSAVLALAVCAIIALARLVHVRCEPQFDQQAIGRNAALFPQMRRWSAAGTRKPIPPLHNVQAHVVLHGGSSRQINEKIEQLAAQLERSPSQTGVILLKDATYHINKRVRMRSNIILKGQSRDGVRCVVNMTSRSAFFLGNIQNSGLYRMTISGSWGKPKYRWNIGDDEKNNELPGNDNISVFFSRQSRDCWIDDVKIVDSADFPLQCAGEHITMRNIVVNRVHNKHGGTHGYWIILGRDNLITRSRATGLRHISVQGKRAKYNVFYDNDFRQEISFHVGDGGNNLITRNRITLPKGMPNGSGGGPDYRAVMGPWSAMHEKSKWNNFLYKNKLLERNHGHVKRMRDDKVYTGPIFHKSLGELQTENFVASDIKPVGGELYPISVC